MEGVSMLSGGANGLEAWGVIFESPVPCASNQQGEQGPKGEKGDPGNPGTMVSSYTPDTLTIPQVT